MKDYKEWIRKQTNRHKLLGRMSKEFCLRGYHARCCRQGLPSDKRYNVYRRINFLIESLLS